MTSAALQSTKAAVLPLAALGPRIAIVGPSGSGKSTLAATIAHKAGHEPVHLDQLFHQPGTDWERRPDEEFHVLHEEVLARPEWVVDGNYTNRMPERLERATGVIWLDLPVSLCFLRYLRRCLSLKPRSFGGLAGGSERIKWLMIRHILFVQPRGVARMERLLAQSSKPLVRLRNTHEVDSAYRAWGLGAGIQTS